MTEKEIGIGKLMGYVEEMQKEGINICRPQVQEYYILRMILISKYYGLIQWLVDNDKIDLNNSDLLTLSSELGCAVDTNIVLMKLAIQDNPIGFLTSILK